MSSVSKNKVRLVKPMGCGMAAGMNFKDRVCQSSSCLPDVQFGNCLIFLSAKWEEREEKKEEEKKKEAT